ncbi:hypothetical protein Pfo_005623 [Paulownia fortunei]|nr:hypothetical protein Pfo_005623 [Paulownia fortunei]
MEAQGGAEVRRLHIVYFLSRKGRAEHPHLIRVHHLSKNGVRLRDIKRWLGELRGKDMPESFAWSYKRRYKTGYVWQDLLDEDLVTPISDNEYVLKGSEISSTTNNIDDQKASSKELENQSHSSDTSMYVSTKPSTEIKESSPAFGSETSTLTDDSGQKLELNKSFSDTTKQEANSSTERSTVVLNVKNKKRAKKVNEKGISTTAASSDKPHFTKSYSNGASHIFRNLITCGAVDINDSAVVVTNKQNRPFLNMCSSHQRNVHSAEICKNEKLGGSQMMFGTQHQWSKSRTCDGVKDSAKRKGQCREERAPCAAYKPLNGPNCSQCGKPFKPEKLHAHMKSCKGMKALAKSSAISAAEKTSQISTESRNKDSVSGYFLTH